MSETLKFGNGQWAVKNGSALAYNDTNGNFKPLPFTFDRSTSATRVNKDGLIEVVSNNEPRIDFLNDSNGALLLEPSRSNLITYSEDFSNPAWNKSGTTLIYSNSTISPFGTLNGTLVEGATDLLIGGNNLNDGWGAAGGLNYILTVYVKSKTATKVGLALRENGGGTFSRNEDIPITTNEWKRISVTISSPSSANALFAYFGGSDGDFYIYGAQLEQGSYATSYIPTQGSIGTRDAESCEQTVPNGIIGQTEGTVFIETKLAQEIPSSSGYFSISDGTANNSYIVQFRNNGTLRIYQNGLDGSNLAFVDSNINLSQNNKIAFKYEQSISSMTLYINGVEISLLGGFVYENTTGINSIKMAYVNGSSNLYSEINDIKLYNKALSNTELAALTKI